MKAHLVFHWYLYNKYSYNTLQRNTITLVNCFAALLELTFLQSVRPKLFIEQRNQYTEQKKPEMTLIFIVCTNQLQIRINKHSGRPNISNSN